MSAVKILSNSTAIGINRTAPFVASGGTSPYTYSMAGNGAGGTINSSTGQYVAPAKNGIDTIVATDSLGQIGVLQINVCNSIELVCDILQKQLGLSQGRVYLWDQKIDMPKDSGMFIAVSMLSCKPFSNTIQQNSDGTQTQSTNFYATLQIDAISKDSSARDRKEEILMALNSQYAEQQQNLNGFGIGRITSSFVNLSQIDGAAIPYRFALTVNIQYLVTSTVAASYFDTFQVASVTVNE
jgi:hypothetical protein